MDVIKEKLIKHHVAIFPFKLLQRKNLLFYILSKWIEDQTVGEDGCWGPLLQTERERAESRKSLGARSLCVSMKHLDTSHTPGLLMVYNIILIKLDLFMTPL